MLQEGRDGVRKPLTLPLLTKHPQCPTPGCDLLASVLPHLLQSPGACLPQTPAKAGWQTLFFDCRGGTEVTHAPAERGGNVCNSVSRDPSNTGTASPCRDVGWPKAAQELVCCHKSYIRLSSLLSHFPSRLLAKMEPE